MLLPEDSFRLFDQEIKGEDDYNSRLNSIMVIDTDSPIRYSEGAAGGATTIDLESHTSVLPSIENSVKKR